MTKSFDISFHGNLILDNVYCVAEFAEGESNSCLSAYASPGALANMVLAVAKITSDISIAVDSLLGHDTSGAHILKWFKHFGKLYRNELGVNLPQQWEIPTSEAAIISDINKKVRSSIVKWGACQQVSELDNTKSNWHHILYVDKLPNLTEQSLKSISKRSIISLDMCSNKHTDMERSRINQMLHHADYVFAGSTEALSLTETSTVAESAHRLGSQCRGYAIVHTPTYSLYSNGSNSAEVKCPEILQGPVNVLGAGDNFAAAFITKMLQKEISIPEALEQAHIHATNFIKKQSLEK